MNDSATARTAVAFADLPGWDAAEAEALLNGLARHLPPAVRERPHQARWLGLLADRLARPIRAPRAFVEETFVPLRIEAPGFLTGYYEPMIRASRVREGAFQTPLYRRPPDLVRVTPPRADLPGDGTFARRLADGRLVPYPDRGAIAAGALDGMGLELAFFADPVDAFFAQIQGSARLVFPDGSETRIGYHGKTGHPYTAIGRVMIDRGLLPDGGATMQTIRAALAAAPERIAEILGANHSYVFFRERPSMGPEAGPIAGGGVPLIPMRSLAVDRAHIGLGTPVFVETTLPRSGPHNGITIAEDTGSAIVGPARGDLFIGSGDAAGAIAGELKSAARLTLIVPRRALV
ncbi:MltA domain-containing protein [Acuticoccus sp. M5D2P5]|uniref:murein transglycosylase A n=1 Tax=Acuticoccus kalidii TaxID=2910977 RepID=UPI001F30C6DF|nr:MltA domain-containing protein [Acuticoccus kalidii]MCF3933658.1 MltA domain-containing protein [Acuticoccus kalidii]